MHKKIFHLITSIDLGGAEAVAMDLAKTSPPQFESEIIEVFATESDFSKQTKQRLQNEGVKYYSLSRWTKRKAMLVAPFRLLRLLLREKPDIVHSHTDIPDYVLSMALRMLSWMGKAHPKIVRTIHNTKLWRTHQRLGKLTEIGLYDDLVVAVSDAAMKSYVSLRHRHRMPPAPRKEVIHNGIQAVLQKPSPIPLDSAKLNFLFCGRFDTQKGLDFLIRIIPVANQKWKDQTHFYIIGKGDLEQDVAQLASKESNVSVHPPIPNIAGIFHHFDYLLMPSEYEGLVLTSIEASFAGLPVIASRVSGLKETLPEDWGLFFEQGDEEGFLHLLERIFDDKVDRTALQEKSKAYVSAHFSFDRMAQAYNEAYAGLL